MKDEYELIRLKRDRQPGKQIWLLKETELLWPMFKERMGKQQGPTVEYRELYPISCDKTSLRQASPHCPGLLGSASKLVPADFTGKTELFQ